ncbi:MAG: hypothetical protein LBQ64_05845, partial [Bacteroidales bacterium]|nr:hypothetical protein [Bacteroidales bacterium]
MGTNANGNLTTGRINVGNASASHANNYNLTLSTNDSYSCPLTEKPDSIVFWAKFVAASGSTEARMHAIIHTAVDYRDPGGSSNDVVADALLEFLQGSQTWTRYSVPFITGAATTPAFILISFTTNKTPGGGSTNDALYIDDIELIYNKELLASISLDGTPLAGFADTTNVYA